MDTPALTPETLAESSLESPPTHPPTTPFEVPSSLPSAMALQHTSFFTNSKPAAPLSPPESPFNFGAAFKPSARPTLVPAPASPQFQLPVRPRRKAKSPEEKTQPRTRARDVQRAGKENPYFPSIAEQERAERWKKDEARLPLPSPVLVPREHTPPTDDDEAESAASLGGEPLEAVKAEMDWSLSPMERKRAMKIKLPEKKVDEFPGSPESLPASSSSLATQMSAEEYRRTMARHLEEGMRRRKQESEIKKAHMSSFQW